MTTQKVLELPILALRGVCVLPGAATSLLVARPESLAAVEYAMNGEQMLFVTAQKDASIEKPEISDLFSCGVIAFVKQIAKMPDKSVRIVIEAELKGQILPEGATRKEGTLFGEIEVIKDEEIRLDKLKNEAYCGVLKDLLVRFDEVAKLFTNAQKKMIDDSEDLEFMMQQTCQIVPFPFEKRQKLLETGNALERYELILAYLEDEIHIVQIREELKEKVREKVDKSQKEYILREQQRAISEELGESDVTSDVNEYGDRIDQLEASKEVKDAIRKELKRFQSMPPQAGESSMLRGYIETLLEMPWDHESVDNDDLTNAKKILDEDHYGLEKVKERILEFLAVRALTKAKGNSPIICLVGPPGVGKTSIARSVARALDKKYVRISLGGMHDEAEIRGHRRTYLGAMPGRIAMGLKQAGTKNPLMLLDEIDKLSNDYKGDPSSALLEVLDSEQNSRFRDNYIEIPIDLSEVLFIATANDASTIPAPLLDRMEMIELSSYTTNEKIHIAEEHLVTKQIEKNGLKKTQLTISKKAIELLLEGYTREAGVRGMERKISEICRKAARRLIENKEEKIRVTQRNLTEFLGKPDFEPEVGEDESQIGIVTGLAWTSVGGDTLEVEVNIMNGKGEMELTGQLGDVMKESARIGYTYIRSIADQYQIDIDYFSEHDMHIHVPEGAVPKDGPSAGVTMATAMLSAVTQIPVKAHLAMTGEITLRGRVLPVGGLKEKILAAKQFGVKTVIVPDKNRSTVEDLSEEITGGLQIIYAKTMDDVLNNALDKKE